MTDEAHRLAVASEGPCTVDGHIAHWCTTCQTAKKIRAYGRRVAEAVRKTAMEALPSSARRHADAISCIRLDAIIERVSDVDEADNG